MNNNYKNQTREIRTEINYGYRDPDSGEFAQVGTIYKQRNLTIEYDCDTLPIGCCLMGTAHFECNATSAIAGYITKGTCLEIRYYMVDISGNEISGSSSDKYYFYVDLAKTSTDNKTIEITANDIIEKITTADNDEEQRFSGTYSNAYEALSNYFGADYINSSSRSDLTNITLTADECTKLKEYSVRDALGYVVGKSGYYIRASLNAIKVEIAKIGWDDAWYNTDGRESWYINGENQALRIDKINVGIDGESDYVDNSGSVADPTRNEYSTAIFVTNPLGGSASEMSSVLYNCIPAIILTSDDTYLFNARAYETGQVQFRGDPDIQIGNSIVFDDAFGRTHRIIICGLNIDLSGGGLRMEITSKAPRDSFDLQKQDTGSGGGVSQEEMEQYVSENTVSEEAMETYVNENAVSESAMQSYVDNHAIPKAALDNLQGIMKARNSNLLSEATTDKFSVYTDNRQQKYTYCVLMSPSQNTSDYERIGNQYALKVSFTVDLEANKKYQLSFIGTTDKHNNKNYTQYDNYKLFLNNDDLTPSGSSDWHSFIYFDANRLYTVFFTADTTGTATLDLYILGENNRPFTSSLQQAFRFLLNEDYSSVDNSIYGIDYLIGYKELYTHAPDTTFLTDSDAFNDDDLIDAFGYWSWRTNYTETINKDIRSIVLPDLRYQPKSYIDKTYKDRPNSGSNITYSEAPELRTTELTLADTRSQGIEVKLNARRLVDLLKLTQNQGVIPIIDDTENTSTYVETNVTYNVNLDTNGDIDTYDTELTYQHVLDAMAVHKDVFLKINVPGSGHYFAESNENYENAANPTIRFYSVNYLFNIPVLQLFVLDSSDNLTKYSWILKDVVNFTAPDNYSMLTEKAIVDNFVRKPVKIFDKDAGLLVAGTLDTAHYTAGTGISKTGQINYAGTPCISGLNLTGIKYLKVVCIRNDGYGTGNYTAMATFEIPLEYGVPNTASGAPGGTWHIGTAQAPVVRDSNRYMNVFGSVAYPADGSLANCSFEFNGAWTMYGTAATGVNNCYVVGIYAYYD